MAIWLSMLKSMLNFTEMKKCRQFQSQIIFLWLDDFVDRNDQPSETCPGQPEMTSSAAQEKPQQAFFPFYTPI